MSDRNFGDVNREAQDIWDRNAAFWDARMGEGNEFQKLLVAPATERLLDVHPGDRVLDVACGNGVFARRLAALGARVVAGDFSRAFIELARARTTENAAAIDYRVLDATDPAQLLALGEQSFDAAVCNMALMDMAAIDPLFMALTRLLKPGRPFVFSVMHPCFNTVHTNLIAEEQDRNGELVTTFSVRVFKYSNMTAAKGVGMRGQPAAHYYFHRPLNVLFNAGFRAGFVLDGIDEPVFDPTVEPHAYLSWLNFHEIPPVIVARMRLP